MVVLGKRMLSNAGTVVPTLECINMEYQLVGHLHKAKGGSQIEYPLVKWTSH